MTFDDVDLRFFPADGLPEKEVCAWRGIVAGAVADAPGSVSLAFMRVENAWLMLGLYWKDADPTRWAVSAPQPAQPLRRRVIDTLRAAGKSVVES